MRRLLEVVGLVVAVVVLYTVPACAVVAEDNVAAGETVAAEQPAADKEAPKGGDAPKADEAPKAPKLKPCCEAICKNCASQADEAKKLVDEAAALESKDEANDKLDAAAKIVGAVKADMDAKIKPAKKEAEGEAADDEAKAPPTPPCCKRTCSRCLPQLGQALKAIEAAKEAETLDAAKPQMQKASKTLAALKGSMDRLMKPATKAGDAESEKKTDKGGAEE
ncbi:MAG: hypothetical protein JXL80_13070 [Planctomycetes bacterium]|nr:hypothetical protein [Planctomycetota bacterium]